MLLTNQLTRPAAQLIGRYAQRMIIENTIADGIDFFHMDALSSAVAMKVNCDLQLTLMASSLYRLLAGRDRPGLRARQVAAPVPRLRGCHGGGHDHRDGDRGAVPEACPQPVADRGRLRHDGRRDPLAGRQAPATGLRVTSIWCDDRAWRKGEH